MPHIPIYFQKQDPMSPIPTADKSPSSGSSDRDAPSTPLFRIHLDDLSHKGTPLFTQAIDIPTLLQQASDTVLKYLYDYPSDGTSAPAPASGSSAPLPPSLPAHAWPSVRSVTLIVRPMDGVAYTTGLRLDDEHKEIHLSLDYISSFKPQAPPTSTPTSTLPSSSHTTTTTPNTTKTTSITTTMPDVTIKTTPTSTTLTQTPAPPAHQPPSSTTPTRNPLGYEIQGVVTHEMVHVWQSYANGTAPGGLTEGIADWVRLRAGLAPAHWKREGKKQGRKWDDGYETTAYFLDWLECERVGPGTVRRINAALRAGPYEADSFWIALCGEDVEVLWVEYSVWLETQ